MATLQELRDEALLTRDELAHKIGVSPQAIYYWERGITRPRAPHIRALVEVFSKPPAEIRAIIEATAEAYPKKDWAA